jgi:hypothetical protein
VRAASRGGPSAVRLGWAAVAVALVATACTGTTSVEPDAEVAGSTTATGDAARPDDGPATADLGDDGTGTDAATDAGEDAVDAADDDTGPGTGAHDPDGCTTPLPDQPVVALTGSEPPDVSADVAATALGCDAEVVVLVDGDDADALLLAGPVAVAVGGPLLLTDRSDPQALDDRLDDLGAGRVLTLGLDPTDPAVGLAAFVDRGGDVGTVLGPLSEDRDVVAAAVTVAGWLDTDRFVALPADDRAARAAATLRSRPGEVTAALPLPTTSPDGDDHDDLVEVAQRLPAAARLGVLASDAEHALALTDALLAVGVDAEVDPGRVWPPAAGGTVWLADPIRPGVVTAAAVASVLRGESLLPVTGDDLRAGRHHLARLRSADPERWVLVGDLADDAAWQLEVALGPELLPGGRALVLDGTRLVNLVQPDQPAPGDEAAASAAVDAALGRAAEVAGDPTVLTGGPPASPAVELPIDAPAADVDRWLARAAAAEVYVLLRTTVGPDDLVTAVTDHLDVLVRPHVGLVVDTRSWPRDAPDVGAAATEAALGALAGAVRAAAATQTPVVVRLPEAPEPGPLAVAPDLPAELAVIAELPVTPDADVDRGQAEALRDAVAGLAPGWRTPEGAAPPTGPGDPRPALVTVGFAP